MRYVTLSAGLAVLLAATFAQAQSLGQYEYKSRGNIPYGRGGYSDVTSPSFSFSRSYSGRHGHSYLRPSYGYPYYGGGYGGYYSRGFGTLWGGTGLTIGFGYPGVGFSYSAGYPYAYPYGYSGLAPYGTYYRPGDQYLEYYLPPTEPAELNYGPQAVKQFLGLPRNFAMQPQQNSVLDSIAAPLGTPSPLRVASPEKTFDPPSVQAMERADHFIQSGDGLFQQQRYQEALGRYKDAVAAAPTYADAHLRKGLAYLATNRPDEAVESIKLAVQQNPDVADTALNLDGLLGGNPAAKSSILEANARRAVADPQNADLLFAVAVLLYFDEQDAAAAQTFEAAKRAAGGGIQSHIDAFSKHLQVNLPQPMGLEL